jgi:hypothetical protein
LEAKRRREKVKSKKKSRARTMPSLSSGLKDFLFAVIVVFVAVRATELLAEKDSAKRKGVGGWE